MLFQAVAIHSPASPLLRIASPLLCPDQLSPRSALIIMALPQLHESPLFQAAALRPDAMPLLFAAQLPFAIA